MYISKKHKLAFIAVPRTASLSVQAAITGSDFSDETDIATELSDPKDMDVVGEYHMTPAELVSKNLVSEDELNQFTKIGFVREPLSRWVSSVFLGRHIGKLASYQDPFEQIVALLRSDASNLYFNQGDSSAFNLFHYNRYFFKDGHQIVTPYHWEDAEAVTRKLIQEKCGAETEVAFPNIQVNPDGVPDLFKQPVKDWLPSDCYSKLCAYLADDVSFYNSVARYEGQRIFG